MSRVFTDDELLTWEAFATGGRSAAGPAEDRLPLPERPEPPAAHGRAPGDSAARSTPSTTLHEMGLRLC
jgi:hypothetical protein